MEQRTMNGMTEESSSRLCVLGLASARALILDVCVSLYLEQPPTLHWGPALCTHGSLSFAADTVHDVGKSLSLKMSRFGCINSCVFLFQ